jgi:CRP-like cAMP-binding protein/predicted acylesterase/phospholipase RssA
VVSPDPWFEIARNVPLLREINAPAFEILRKEARSFCLAGEDVLFRAGDPADAVHIVVEGSLRLETPGKPGKDAEVLAELGPGDCVGELALLRGIPHSTTTVATGPAQVVEMRRVTLDRMMAQDSQLGKKLLDIASRRMVSTRLASIPLLAGIGEIVGSSMDLESNWQRLKAGQILFQRGHHPEFLYVLVSGRLEVVTFNSGDEEERLDLLAPGACIGDMELLTGEPTQATVRAARSSELVRLSRDQFEAILQDHAPKAARIARAVLERARMPESSRTRGRANVSVIVCMPARAGEPYRRFIAEFADSLARFGKTVALSRRTLESLQGSELPDNPASEPARRSLTDWIADHERNSRYVLVEADTRHTLWTESCLAQADLVLILADADDDPEPGELERALYDGGIAPRARRELVLLHPNRSRSPSETRRRLAARRVSAHHHLVSAERSDVDRLARMVTGRAVGVVLGGGGGVRGYSQIGMLKALRECAIPVDMAGGTGTGAIIAAQLAMCRDIESIAATYGGIIRSLGGRARDLTPPLSALLSGRAYVEVLRSTFGDAAIEDLWLPFFSVASSLTGNRHLQHEGPLWMAIRSASSVPGVMPPVRSGGDLLVDGSLLGSVPADVMRRRCGGYVVAVDACHGPAHSAADGRNSLPVASGWSLLWRHLLRRRRPFPGIIETLYRATLIGGSRDVQAIRAVADIYLRLPADGIGTFEWGRAQEAIETGYRYAKEELARAPLPPS